LLKSPGCPAAIAAEPRIRFLFMASTPPSPAGFAHALILAWCVLIVSAFDYDGHDAVGQTTASAMDQVATKTMKRLLGGKDASDVAGWGHQVDATFPGMARLHFQVHDDSVQPFCGPVEQRVAKCDDNLCLLQSIKNLYGNILQDEGRKTDYPPIDYDKASKGLKFTDADEVKMLLNLIGDMHQPLHVGYAGDDTGRKVMIRFRGKEMSLYDFWDKGISETVRNDESNFWLGGWTHVSRVAEEFEKDKEAWKEQGAPKMFDRWMEESVKFACDVAYKHPTTGQMMAGPQAGTGPFDIDEQAYQVWREKWLRQVLIAGERLAVVMNDILAASGAAKLSKEGVKTDADKALEKEKEEWVKLGEENRKQEASRPRTSATAQISLRVIFTNLAIAAVTVPLFIFFVNYGLDPRVIKLKLLELFSKSSDAGAAPAGRRRD